MTDIMTLPVWQSYRTLKAVGKNCRIIDKNYRNATKPPKKGPNTARDYQVECHGLIPQHDDDDNLIPLLDDNGHVNDRYLHRTLANGRSGDLSSDMPGVDSKTGLLKANNYHAAGHVAACIYIKKGLKGHTGRHKRAKGCDKRLMAPDKGDIQKYFTVNKHNYDPDISSGRTRELCEKRKSKIQKRMSKRKNQPLSRIDNLCLTLWRSGKVKSRSQAMSVLKKLGGYSDVSISMAVACIPQ